MRVDDYKLGRFVVFRSKDPEAVAEDWDPIHYDDVPDGIKGDPDAMTRISQGDLASIPGDPDEYFYRAEFRKAEGGLSIVH